MYSVVLFPGSHLKKNSVLQVTENWAGPGNKAMNSVASTIVRLQYPGAHESPRQSSKFSFALTKSHVIISLNSHSEKLSSLIKTSKYVKKFL